MTGIAPGNTIDAIRAKYPGIQPTLTEAVTLWPSFGVVEFFQDTKLGIAFAIRKKDNVCIQIMVTPAGARIILRPVYPNARRRTSWLTTSTAPSATSNLA